MNKARIVLQNLLENYFYVPDLNTVIAVSYLDWIFNLILVVVFSRTLSTASEGVVWNEEWYHEDVRNMTILLVLHITELLSVTVLLYSLHTKNWRLMRIYLYCGIVAAPFVILLMGYDYFTAALYHFSESIDTLVDLGKIALQIYLLILVRNSYRCSNIRSLHSSKDLEEKLCLI